MNNKYERKLNFENIIEKISLQINSLIENLEINSLEDTFEKLFKIFSFYTSNDKELPLLQSKVADLLNCLMENWQKNGKNISDLKKEIITFFEKKDNIPIFFKNTRSEKLGKRQPDIIESIYSTLERFEMMEALELVFKKSCKGIIIGGSLSYGPFYNIRANKDNSGSSDIDAIFVLDQNSTDDDWKEFLHCPFFSEQDKKNFMSRKNIFFKSLLPENKATILSQKFHLEGTDYDISIHFFTDEALNKTLISNIEEEVQGNNKVVILKDYKSKPFSHTICPQTNFDGTPYYYTVPEQKNTNEGVITELPAYIINDHKFHPGIYQNLILPTFFIFHDRNGEITDKISKFKKIIKDHIQNTYGKNNVEERLLKSHIRNKIFPLTLKEQIKD